MILSPQELLILEKVANTNNLDLAKVIKSLEEDTDGRIENNHFDAVNTRVAFATRTGIETVTTTDILDVYPGAHTPLQAFELAHIHGDTFIPKFLKVVRDNPPESYQSSTIWNRILLGDNQATWDLICSVVGSIRDCNYALSNDDTYRPDTTSYSELEPLISSKTTNSILTKFLEFLVTYIQQPELTYVVKLSDKLGLEDIKLNISGDELILEGDGIHYAKTKLKENTIPLL